MHSFLGGLDGLRGYRGLRRRASSSRLPSYNTSDRMDDKVDEDVIWELIMKV